MSDDREFRTRFSMAALDLATMFKMQLGSIAYGQVKFRPELDAPSNVSTQGGLLALQHLRLVPGSQGFTPLICGAVNGPQAIVELRIYDYVDAAHRQRFGKAVPIDRQSYDQFLHMAREFFASMQMQVKLLSTPAEVHEPSAPEEQTSSRSIVPWIIAGLIVAGIVVGLVLALRKG